MLRSLVNDARTKVYDQKPVEQVASLLKKENYAQCWYKTLEDVIVLAFLGTRSWLILVWKYSDYTEEKFLTILRIFMSGAWCITETSVVNQVRW